MIKITEEKIYFDEISISRNFTEKHIGKNIDANFINFDGDKSFKINNSNQLGLSEDEVTFLKDLEKKKDEIISLYQESIKPPKLTLKKLKLQKLSEAENYRKFLQFQPIEYNGQKLSSSEISRQNILSNIISLDGGNATIFWRDEDKIECSFCGNEFKEIINLITKRDELLYRAETKIQKLIDSTKDAEQLKALNIQNIWQEHQS